MGQVMGISTQDSTRGNGYKLEKNLDSGPSWVDIGSLTVVNDWNRLGKHVVSAESIGSFKRQLDECMDRDDRWDG